MNIRTGDAHAVQRLNELLGWADYIVESLTMDQGYEKGKLVSLQRVVDGPSLQELRQVAWMLREKLDRVRVQSEVMVPKAS